MIIHFNHVKFFYYNLYDPYDPYDPYCYLYEKKK